MHIIVVFEVFRLVLWADYIIGQPCIYGDHICILLITVFVWILFISLDLKEFYTLSYIAWILQ